MRIGTKRDQNMAKSVGKMDRRISGRGSNIDSNKAKPQIQKAVAPAMLSLAAANREFLGIINYLAKAPTSVAQATKDVISLAALVRNIHVTCNEAGDQLIATIGNNKPKCFPLKMARGKLRSMCAQLAVTIKRPRDELPVFGGKGIVQSPAKTPHCLRLNMVNSSAEHWFELVRTNLMMGARHHGQKTNGRDRSFGFVTVTIE